VRPWAVLAQVVLPVAGLVALRLKALWPTRAVESGRFFHLSVLAYAAMLPMGLAAFLKIGGDINALHSWSYLLPGGLVAWFAADRISATAPARLLAVTAVALALHAADFISLPLRPLTEHFARAARLTANYPHAIWFPRNPLITFYADRTLWHSEDGVLTRNLAGFAPRESDFRRHLPPNLQAVAYPEAENISLAAALLPEFSRTTLLPHWILLTRPPPASPGP